MARIVVAGYIVRYPLGGNVWAHFQYVLGLARLGHEVWYMEEAGWEDSCYDPTRDAQNSDPTYGLRMLAGLMEHFGLAHRWAYRDSSNRWHGLDGARADELIASADLFLDVGGTNDLPQMKNARRRAYIDMDPAFTQFRAFGAHSRLDTYDTLFTYGANIGRGSGRVPTGGFEWKPLRPAVALDLWDVTGHPTARKNWTTVAHWTAYGACEYEGETYGQKDVEFLRFIHLPMLTSQRLELAVSGDDVPYKQLRANGWQLADPLAVSDPWRYREYIWNSRGEFSVAKNAYVKTACGWFSDRTASYLAAGRPAIVQDTGIRDDLPTGCGLLVFRTMDDAVAALDEVESNYEAHCRSARAFAAEYLDATKVLDELLNQSGV